MFSSRAIGTRSGITRRYWCHNTQQSINLTHVHTLATWVCSWLFAFEYATWVGLRRRLKQKIQERGAPLWNGYHVHSIHGNYLVLTVRFCNNTFRRRNKSFNSASMIWCRKLKNFNILQKPLAPFRRQIVPWQIRTSSPSSPKWTRLLNSTESTMSWDEELPSSHAWSRPLRLAELFWLVKDCMMYLSLSHISTWSINL